MDLSLQKRLASEILDVGKDRIWIDPNKIQDVSKALSRSDILDLIDKGIIRENKSKVNLEHGQIILNNRRKKEGEEEQDLEKEVEKLD